jgi:hypothetical protein
MRPVEYIQLISRVANLNCEEAFATKWFPDVDVEMTHCFLTSAAMLQYYVLHAKHSNLEQTNLNFATILDEKFQEIKEDAELD